MKKMLFLSAALLAVLAGPALAQDRRGGEGRRGPDAAQAQQGGRDFNRGGAVGNGSRAPEAAPAQAQRGGGDRGGFRGGDRGQRDFGQRNNAAPAAPAAQAAPRDFNRGSNPAFAQRDNNGGRDFNRGGNDNRNGFRGGNGQQNFGRNDGRRDNFNGGNYNGRNNQYGRSNNQRYSQYYRSYNAQRRFRIGSYYRPAGYSYRRWSYGDFLPSLYWSNRYWLNDYYAYDLTPPMPGTVWVRYGDDALLIDRYTGEVIQVAYGIFW